MQTEILTPETHPDHHTVGRFFNAWDGLLYYCDSYDPRIGYWMTALCVNPTNGVPPCNTPPRRTNVSERAIGGTFHEIYIFDPRRPLCIQELTKLMRDPPWTPQSLEPSSE